MVTGLAIRIGGLVTKRGRTVILGGGGLVTMGRVGGGAGGLVTRVRVIGAEIS